MLCNPRRRNAVNKAVSSVGKWTTFDATAQTQGETQAAEQDMQDIQAEEGQQQEEGVAKEETKEGGDQET